MRFKKQIWVVFWLLVFCGSVSAVEPNLIAHWELDEGGGDIAYDSAGDNDGNVYGAVWTGGVIDGALDFDGIDDYVSVPDDSSLDISGAITVSAWVELSNTVDSQVVVGKVASGGGYSGGGYRMIFNSGTGYSDGTFRLIFQKADGTYGTASGNYGDNTNWDRVVSDKNDWETGVWYHVTGVWDGTTDSQSLKMYVDGVLDANHTASQSVIKTNNYALQIGRTLYSSPSSQFNGKIDDVRIYDRALSAEEVRKLYLSGPSSYERAVINIEEALADKAEAIDIVEAAIAKEQAAGDALDELLEGGDYGDPAKSDIVRAMSKVQQAIQAEEQSLYFLDKSVEDLEDSLEDLGWDPNLVAHWKLDEGSGDTAYDSAGDNDGAVYGAAWTAGQIGGALSFDGNNDYVAVPSFTVSTYNGTISLWFKTSADFSANYGSQGYLISRNSQYYGYLTVAGNGAVPYWIVGETNSQDDYFVVVEGAAPAGVWNHVVVSFDNKTAKTYLNGALIQTVPVTNSSLTLNRIGGRTLEFFSGVIDDVRIYNRALSAEQVQELYEDSM